MARKHLLGAAATLALGGAAMGWRACERADERAVAADPEQAALGRPLGGIPVAVESGDGTVLHAELFGPPDRPTIVLIHGWVCSLELWHYQIAERLAGVMLVNVGVERLIAEARIVITAGALSRLEQLVGSRMLDLPLPAPRRLSPVVSRVVRYVALTKEAGPAQVAFCVRMFLGCRPDVRAAFGATLAGLDLLPALDALVVPTVVVAGELDRLTPPVHARAIAGALPDVHLVELAATGHTSPLEAHSEVTGLLRTLADRVLVAPRDSLAADG